MSYRYEFVAELRDGTLEIPGEILARLRLKGLGRLHVVITTVAEAEERLAERGIDSEMIDMVAGAQKYDRDVASMVLQGEGAAVDEPELARRLVGLLGSDAT